MRVFVYVREGWGVSEKMEMNPIVSNFKNIKNLRYSVDGSTYS